MDRRELLSYSVVGLGCTMGGAVALPLLINILSPAFSQDTGEDWHPLGPVSDFPVSAMTQADFQINDQKNDGSLSRRSLYVWRKSEDAFIVYSRACTDLGCPLVWDKGSEWFFCPCHGGIFDKNGERRAGPPKYPLWRYKNRVRDAVLEIDVRSVPPMA